MKFDDIVIELGEFGRYQRRLYFLICLIGIPCGFQSLVPVFLAGESDHWCVVPELETQDCVKWPEVTPELCDVAKKDASIPPQTRSNSPYEYDNCIRYNLTEVPFFPGVHTPDYTNDTFKCTEGWVYDTSRFKSTIISQFDLVCVRGSLPGISQSIYFVGILVGSFVFGLMSDVIGRYKTYFITGALFLASTMAVSFSPGLIAYTIFRFLVGMANIGVWMAAFILGTEFVGPSKRMVTGIAINFFFSTGFMLLALMAFLIRDWFILNLVVSAPIVLIFLIIPAVSESPRWLMSRGRFDEAEVIIRKVAKVNKAVLPDIIFEEHEKEKIIAANKEHRPTVIDLFRTPTLRWRTFNLMFNWTVNVLIYYGLSLSTSDLGSDPYVAFFLSGLVEIPAQLWVLFAIEWFGRKPNQMGLLIIGGVACLATIITPSGAAKTTVAMVGKFCAAGSFSLVYVYTAELYPTSTRGAGIGICSLCARIGGIIAPLILIMGDYWEPLPFLIFGSSSIIAGLLVLFLPETKGQQLPETLEEGENFGKRTISEKDTHRYPVSFAHTKNNPAFVDDTDEIANGIN